ncbi:MAG: aminotransferase class III-fold pyridoxal phosphate-dependent enzyme [Dehalococcoidales bacterium]|jgi:taurine--2-oxoglutarate transaminase|nr:aminotransferase class III-fold pyridoxal phosphate-dependent enzyme [Dehalococcoidales bacterium]MDP6577524.1 aminotransferase class III-fold pyridoxal phosphate-dependent enzyme [Dehalococcoidales bacterium]|tara:strand:- start:742 stop:1023 length:282 start_codon:yes stop_codon:yes gene_type:complete
MAKSEEQIKAIAEHTYGTWKAQKDWKKPVCIRDAEGVYMYDSNDKRYIDFSSQLMCTNLGHKNQAIIEAIATPEVVPTDTSGVRSSEALSQGK